MERLTITNGRLILPTSIEMGQTLIYGNGKIEQIIPDGSYQPLVGDKIIDTRQNYVSPEFIDVYIREGGGRDFMDGTIEAFLGMAETHTKYGTTAMVPTTLTGTNEELTTMSTVYRKAKEVSINGSQFINLHLEGPYFSPKQYDAQDPNFLRESRAEGHNAILETSKDITRWDVAPEPEGALALGQALQQHHILSSIVHTDAIYGEAERTSTAGYTHAIHLYSAMSSVTRKGTFHYAGVVEAAYLIEDVIVGIIAGGIHLPKPLLRFVYKLKGIDEATLCTDAMRGADIPDDESILDSLNSSQKVIIEDGVAKMPDRKAFAGSVATAGRLVRTMIYLAGVPPIDTVRMMALTPARIFHVDKERGSLGIGEDTGAVVLDNQVNINDTILKGHTIYTK